MKRYWKKVAALAVAAALMVPAMGMKASAESSKINAEKMGKVRYSSSDWTINTANHNSDTNNDGTGLLEYSQSGGMPTSNVIMPATYFKLDGLLPGRQIFKATIHLTASVSKNGGSVDLYSVPVNTDWTNAGAFAGYESKHDTPLLKVIKGETEPIATGATVSSADGTDFDVTDQMKELVAQGEGYAGYAIFVSNRSANYKVTFSEPVLTVEYAEGYFITVGGQAYEANYNDKVTLKADEKNEEGKTFSYWTKNGKTISYDQTYTFYVSGGDTIEAVYEDTPAEPKGCYYITYRKDEDDLVITVECNFPAGTADGRMIIAPEVIPTGGANSMKKIDNSNLSGNNQYRLKLGGVSQFDASKYTKSRVKFEGIYGGGAKKAWNGGFNYWFTGADHSNSTNVTINLPDVEPGQVSTTF